MKRAKCLSLLLSVLLTSTLLSACGSNGTQSDTKAASQDNVVTVKMAVVTSPTYTAQYWDNFMKQIEKDNPGIKMEAVLAPGTDRETWMKTKYAAGDVPDIITTEVSEFGDVQGALAEVPQDLISNFPDSAVAKNNGKVLMVPASLQIKSQVFYNKKMFADAGITDVPKTWKEFTDDCEKLKAKQMTPLIGSKESWFNFGYYTAVAWPDMLDSNPNFLKDVKSGKAKWNNPTLAASLQKYQDLNKKGYFHKGSNSFAYTQTVDEFFKGSAAMIMNGSWMAPQIDQLKEKPSFDIGVFPLPQENGVKNIGATTTYWGVFNSSKVKDAAFKVIKYCLVDNKDLYSNYLKNDNLTSVTKTPVTYETTPTINEFNKNAEGLKYVMDFAGIAGDDSLPSGFADYLNDSIQAIFNGKDVATTLNDVDQEYQSLINK